MRKVLYITQDIADFYKKRDGIVAPRNSCNYCLKSKKSKPLTLKVKSRKSKKRTQVIVKSKLAIFYFIEEAWNFVHKDLRVVA